MDIGYLSYTLYYVVNNIARHMYIKKKSGKVQTVLFAVSSMHVHCVQYCTQQHF